MAHSIATIFNQKSISEWVGWADLGNWGNWQMGAFSVEAGLISEVLDQVLLGVWTDVLVLAGHNVDWSLNTLNGLEAAALLVG